MKALAHNVPLAPLTTFRVGGPAQEFVALTSKQQLPEIHAYVCEQSVPYCVLGGGSNVLVADAGFAGLVIHMQLQGREIVYTDEESVHVRVAAGEMFDPFVAWSVAEGYWGVENLSHIPGTVGATPIQNIGAYGVEIADVIEAVDVFDIHTGTSRTLRAAECAFGYRDSVFKTPAGAALIVTAVTYRLSRVAKPVLGYRDIAAVFIDQVPTQAAIRDAIIAIRSAKFPDWSRVGTAGSFFKNPIISQAHYADLVAEYPLLPSYETADAACVKVPLGWILEHVCALRGYSNGAVGSYAGQALVVVTEPGAQANDIKLFAEYVAEEVKEKTSITIEWEVTPVGF